MILIYIIILLFIYINNIKCFNLSDENSTISFNNDLNHMFFSKKSFILYLGTEVAFLKIEQPLKQDNIEIYFDKKSITFKIKEIDEKIYEIDNNYTVTYLGDNKILFNKSDEFIIFRFIKNSNFSEDDNGVYNICYEDNPNITFYFSNVENLFIKKYLLAFVLFFSGCFSILFGAYHYMTGLVIHLTILTYFFIFELIAISTTESISKLSTYFFIFFCFIFSLSIAKFLYTEKKNNKRYNFLKFIHGLSFGFIIFKIFCYYYLFLDLPKIHNDQGRINVVFAMVTIFTLLGGFLNLFNPFKKFIFLPCAAVSGSWYLIKGAQYLIGGYFSDIVAIKEIIEFDYMDNRTQYILTYFFIQIIIIVFSIIFQVIHIEYKQTELEEEEPYTDERISNASNISSISTTEKNEPQELMDKNQNENMINKEDEDDNDNEINDQEDD